LVQFVFSLPSSFKIHAGWTKSILRKTIQTSIPDPIVWRKEKIGYEPPQRSWMENKLLADYIQEAKRKLVRADILAPAALNKKVQPQDAYAAENNDWRYLVAAGCMS
jgi:asparagine synthase (glutamine-hydrolysing)